MTARYTPATIANEFLHRAGMAGKTLTPMQLLKLVYIAHGWHMAVNAEPLFDEAVEAWKYGPVVPSLFHEFKEFGGTPIRRLAHAIDVPVGGEEDDQGWIVRTPFVPPSDSNAHKLLDWVWQGYGGRDGGSLSDMTHEPGTPWSETVAEMKKNNPHVDWVNGYPIPNERIRSHYLTLWAKRNGQRTASK
jgi:uncharacterized phage-associated protein